MSAELNYDEGPLLDVAMACRRFIAEVEGLPAAAVMLMVPALCQHLEDRLSLEMMRGREVQLGRELTPEECEQEAAFVGEELLRGEGEAQERMPDLLYMLRFDTLVVDEDPREMPKEERKKLFSALVSEPEPIGSAIRASQDFWRKMVAQEVDLETRLLIVSHLQGVCMHFMLTEEIERRKLELGRELSHDDLDVVIDQVMRKRNGIEEIAKSQREELEDLVSKLGKHARPAPAKSPAHLLYIA